MGPSGKAAKGSGIGYGLGKAMKAKKATVAWGSFIESASESPGKRMAAATRQQEGTATGHHGDQIAMINPTAAEDPPSMYMLSRGLDRVREDVARVSGAVDEIKDMLRSLKT